MYSNYYLECMDALDDESITIFNDCYFKVRD